MNEYLKKLLMVQESIHFPIPLRKSPKVIAGGNFLVILICLSAVACCFSSAFCAADNEPESLLDGSSLQNKDGLLVLHLKGTPYQMGYQHGRLLKEHIRVIYQDYLLGTLREYMGGRRKFKAALNFFKRKSRILDKFIPEEYKQELKGIADGSGFSYTDILLLHTFLDVLSYPRVSGKEFKSCTNFVVLNKASLDSKLIHARTLSWPSKGILEEHTAVIFYQPKNGNAFAAISWPGICGVLTGMNDKGVTLGETSVGTAESTFRGIPAFLLLRKALQYSDTLYDAIRIISSSGRTTGYTVTLSDGKLNKACVLEFTDRHYSVRFPEDDYLVSTNHFQDSALFETMKPVYPNKILEDTSSYQRLKRMQELIRANYGKIDAKKSEELFSDQTMCTQNTFVSAVLEPQGLKFSVSVGNSGIKEGKFVDFDLSEELGIKLPRKEDFIDPEEFYAYEKEVIKYEEKLIEETAEYKKYEVIFPSIVKTDFPENKVYLRYYEPKNARSFPAVLVMPHTEGASDSIEGQFCRSLAENGIAALTVNMAYQEKLAKGNAWLQEELKKEDLSSVYALFKQLVIESRRGIDWLEGRPGVDKENIGILGISLGAIAAPIVVATDGRIKSAMYVLGGGNVSNILYGGKELPFFKQRLIRQNISPLDFESRYSVIDPLTFAFKAKSIPAVMYNSVFDSSIPETSTLELWQALERPKIYWMPASHYTAVLFLGNVMYVTDKHFSAALKQGLAEERKGFKVQAMENVQLSQENFLNKKIKITGTGKYADREKRVRMGLLKEDIFNTPFFAGMDLSGRWEGDERYDLKGQGRDIYLGMNVTPKTKLTLRFDNQDITTYRISDDAPQILKESAGNSQVSDTALILERSTLDNRYYPKTGVHHRLEWDYAAENLGGDYNFNRLIWQSRGYATPGEFFTFALRTRFGWMEEFGGTVDTPYFERFFAGGSGTIRGYKGRQVGPKDGRNLALGGNFSWINSLEARFPIYKRLAGAVFSDAGGLWVSADKFKWKDIKCGAGLGLRYITKWGVARIDYGVRLTRDKDEPRSRVHVTFGIPF